MGSPMAITPSPLKDSSEDLPSDSGREDLVDDATMVDGQESAFTFQGRQAGFGDPISGSIKLRYGSIREEIVWLSQLLKILIPY